MKKSTLLSLLTAGSIVLTSAGTYAAWDNLEANATKNNLTFRNPVTITVDTNTLSAKKGELDVIPTASGDVTFTVENNVSDDADLANRLTLVPEVKNNAQTVLTSKFDFAISNDAKTVKAIAEGNTSQGFIDTISGNGDKKYSVTITPKEAYRDEIKGEDLTVKLSATLSKAK